MWRTSSAFPPQARLGPPDQQCAAACESSPTTAAPRCTVLPADLPDLMSSCNGPTCMSAVLCAVSCHPAACRTPSQKGSGPPCGPCRRPSAAACSRRGRPAHRRARLQPAQRPRRPHLPRSPGYAGPPAPAAAASMQIFIRRSGASRQFSWRHATCFTPVGLLPTGKREGWVTAGAACYVASSIHLSLPRRVGDAILAEVQQFGTRQGWLPNFWLLHRD